MRASLGGKAPPATGERPGSRSPGGDDTGKRKGGSLLDLLVIFAVSLVLMFGVIRPFVAEIFYIPSQSMAPTIQAGDRVLAAKFAYRLGDPDRGELAVLTNPEDGDEVLIKRIVGVAGDSIEIRDGMLYVNGEPQREAYVDYRISDGQFFGPVEVAEDHVFVLGDNRANSRDSRFFGPVPERDLSGRVILQL